MRRGSRSRPCAPRSTHCRLVVGKALCRALVREDRAAAAVPLAPGLAGRFVAGAAADAAPGEAAIGARSRPPVADTLGRDALLDRLWTRPIGLGLAPAPPIEPLDLSGIAQP